MLTFPVSHPQPPAPDAPAPFPLWPHDITLVTIELSQAHLICAAQCLVLQTAVNIRGKSPRSLFCTVPCVRGKTLKTARGYASAAFSHWLCS